MVDKRFEQELNARDEDGILRSLKSGTASIDFASNDYLGFAQSEELRALAKEIAQSGSMRNGTGGSRLLAGNTSFHERAEAELAQFFKAESATLFTSGYTANLGLLSVLLKRNDTVLYDELSHASIKDGIRLGYAKAIRFRHNDVEDLSKKLKKLRKGAWVIVESIYSMDGDLAPLKEIARVCQEHDAQLLVDEAHASGIFGQGRGLTCALNLEDQVFARVHTFGKSLGSQGAAVLGSLVLKQYLINFSRPFIYTTAPSESDVALMLAGVRLLNQSEASVQMLEELVLYFIQKARQLGIPLVESKSQIQGILTCNNQVSEEICAALQVRDIDARPIKSPTVPQGLERIRICLHTYNTKEEIDLLLQTVKEVLNG